MVYTSDITVIVVNYRTPDLLRYCVESFLLHCGGVHLLLIDNGSCDVSRVYIETVAGSYDPVQCLMNDDNHHHGPALDQGIRQACTRYIFTMDSDCRVLHPHFLETMRSYLQESGSYAVGRLQHKNLFGYDTPPRTLGSIRYIDPAAMLLDRNIYRSLPPFAHHGAPCLKNMRSAQHRGYHVGDFPIDRFVDHLGKGTCSRYGYGLGNLAKIENILNRLLQLFLSHQSEGD